MRGLPKFPQEYFSKFKDKKVVLVPFDPKAKSLAQQYIKILRSLLTDFDLEILHRGSTAMGIAGKGEIEIGVYPREEDWEKVIKILAGRYGKIENLETDYARFNDMYQGTEIECQREIKMSYFQGS